LEEDLRNRKTLEEEEHVTIKEDRRYVQGFFGRREEKE
jgi:hypothetical protein